MKKLLLLFAVMLSAVGAWAQTTTKVKGEILSAETLMAKTEAVNIVIQNISGTNRWYFCGNKNLEAYETNSETWFMWEPSGDGETFYLKKQVPGEGQGEGYLQSAASGQNITIGAKETAQKFKAVFATPTDDPHADADADNLVRFVKADESTVWINCQTTGGTPKYNSGTGAYTMHNVYVIEDVAVKEVSAVGDLSNDKVYTLKSGRSSETTSHYLLYHSDAPDNLSSTYSNQGHSLEYSDETNNFHFAIYKNDDKYYFYNIAAAKFIGNNDNNNGAIPLVEIPTNAVEIRSSNNATYNFVLSTNGTGALNAADTYGCHGVVNWTGGYNNLTDGGNIYQITEVGELDAATKAIIEERINVGAVLAPARQAVENASDVLVGAYTTVAVATLSEKLVAYDANATTETFEAVKNAYNDLLTNGAKVELSAGEIFMVKCLDTNRGYMVYSTVEGKGSETQAYLAGTNRTEFHASLDAEGIYKEWAVLEVDGKKYIYNVQNKKFITSDNIVLFSETAHAHALNFVDINNALWEIQFESNNRFLSFSPGWGADCVRTEPGIDDGCKFYLEKVGSSVGESVSTEMEDKINLEAWKADNIAILGYVGGYPTSMQSAINAVTTYSEALAFDADNADKRIVLAEGYYFIKGTGNGNGADWYATYGDDASPAFAAPAIGSETPAVKHIWKFVACENGYKFQACNLDKYVNLDNAESTNSGPSPISSDFNGGSKFVFEDQGAGKFVIKDGNGNVMRSEGSGKGYALNYWWGETNESWYIIPATELDITVSEAGWATTCLPFDVVLPEELTAYALTDVSGVKNGEETGSVSLISKAGIKANQGALLKGDAGTYTLSIEETASNWDANLLSGTTVAKDMSAVEGDVYLLTSDGAGSAQLSKLELADDATDAKKTLAANKAYLNIAPSATRFLVFSFGDDTETAIEGIEAENTADAVVYDLAGRRVQKAQKGLYIVNGKKVIK